MLGINEKEKRYFLAPSLVSVADLIQVDRSAEIKLGNRLELKNIPIGMSVFNVEAKPGLGGKLAKASGTFIKILQKTAKNEVLVKLSSGK